MIKVAGVLLILAATPAMAQDRPWEVPREEQDVPSLDAVHAANECLGVQYGSFGRYGACNDVVFAACRPRDRLGFGARDCLEQAHHAWRHIIWDLVQRLAGQEAGGTASDGRPMAVVANERWEAFAEAQCSYGLSPSHPYQDDPDWQRRACLTELAAAQAIRLWATLAP